MMRITVVGAGGIGCAVGHALCAAGVTVTFVDANPAKVRWGQENGVGIEGVSRMPAQFVHFADWHPDNESLILLCTKCYCNADVLDRLAPGTPLLPIQNGFDDRLEKFGPACEGIASFVSECPGDRTVTRITRSGKLHLGTFEKGRKGEGEKGRQGAGINGVARPESAKGVTANSRLLREFAATLKRHAAFGVEVVPNILAYKYTKLMYNAAVGPIASAAGIDNGGLLWRPTMRRLFFQLLLENYRILKAAGIELAQIGPFHPDSVQRILRRPFISSALAWIFYPSLRGTYCSMAGDLPRGRTEIDNYNGHLVRIANGRDCALNQRIYDLVRKMEKDRLRPEPSRLDGLLAA